MQEKKGLDAMEDEAEHDDKVFDEAEKKAEEEKSGKVTWNVGQLSVCLM